MKRSKMKPSSFAVPGKKKYPVHDAAHARNAIARVQQHGSPSEKRAVFAAVRRRYPAIANRSKVIPTRSGPGRRYGQAAGRSRSGRR